MIKKWKSRKTYKGIDFTLDPVKSAKKKSKEIDVANQILKHL